MPRPPYTRETVIVVSASGPTITLLESEAHRDSADLSITPIYDGKSIPLAPLLEWLAINRPSLLFKAQAAAARIAELEGA